MKRVRATAKGYAPKEPGQPCQRIYPGDEILVEDDAKAKWFEEIDAPAKRGGRPKSEPDTPAPAE